MHSQTIPICDKLLAAALLSVGVLLNQRDKCQQIEGEGVYVGYSIFNFLPQSYDGDLMTEDCMSHWCGNMTFHEDNPFAKIYSFASKNAKRCSKLSEWFAAAMDEIGEMPGLKSPDQIEDYVKAAPHLTSSYVLAFVANLRYCHRLAKSSQRMVYQSRDNAHALIDVNLPKPIRNELLARLSG